MSPSTSPAPEAPLDVSARRFRASSVLAVVGPGIVVAGSVMGGGELINTPVQAAKFGFVLLWAVLLSCVIKYFLQLEIGRHAVIHGRTTYQLLNLCPGPKIRNTSWVGLAYMLGYVVTMLTAAGIIGALAGMMHFVMPILVLSDAGSVRTWAVLIVALAAVLLAGGVYSHLELLVAVLVGIFSLSVVAAAVALQGTPYRVSWADFSSGLTFSLGEDRRLAGYAVVSLMGALGTTANELFMYPYWLLEKGSAERVGDSTNGLWKERARKAIRDLSIDVGFATALATLTTAAFFLLGAAVLHRQDDVPQGLQVVQQISQVYTESYGVWSQQLFLVGAFCTLFSTLVVIAAASGRMWGDLLASMGWLDRRDPQAMRRCHRWMQTLWLAGLLAIYLAVRREPAGLVIFGQFFVGAFCTPLLMFAICWIAFRTDSRVRMGAFNAVALLVTTLVLAVCVVGGLLISFFGSG